MRVKRIGAYVGIDPTADSMHLGHLLPFMALFWLHFHGHPAVTLLGGATARIGDPTDRLESRTILSNADISKNVTKLHFQLARLWTNVRRLQEKHGFEYDWAAKKALLNNNMWLGKLTLYDFNKRLARHMRMGPLLSRDTVKRRMNEGDAGMSLGEFMYPLLQGWDFWHLYIKHNVQMQIGGSDQYGNIVSGIEVLKTARETEEAPHYQIPDEWQNEPCGFTVPLLTDSSGAKFGKSAGNAMWLDEYKTSPFDLYGYFMRQPDDQVEKLLKLFTFIPLKDIAKIMERHNEAPQKRVANHIVAFEVLSLVFGAQRAMQEAQQHAFRFGGELPPEVGGNTKELTHQVNPNNAPRSDMKLPRSVMGLSPARILMACGLVDSKNEGDRLLRAQGAYVAAKPGKETGLVPGNLDWTPMKLWFPGDTEKFIIEPNLLIMRKGKHNVRIIELVTDQEWEQSGQIYPGQPYTGKIRRLVAQLKEEAAARGEDKTEAEIRAELKEKIASEPMHVANNPDIELPSKQEIRDMKEMKKASKEKNGSGEVEW